VLRALGGRVPAHVFRVIPYMALQVDETDLTTLAAHPEVTGIEIDRADRPTLAESTALIGAPHAWTNGFTGSGWTIAVLDTGVDAAHPFLAGKVVSDACYSSTVTAQSTSVCPGGASSSTTPGSAMPCAVAGCDHGTHVAGIAAGSGGAFSGVAPGASLISVQVFSEFATGCDGAPACPRSYVSDQMRGLERVYELRTTFNIAAVNMSLGGGLFTTPCDGSGRKAMIDQLRAAGIATVVSSGNDGATNAISEPSCISSAISVGSTTDGSFGRQADEVSDFSNANEFLQLLAPGEVITSSVPGGGFASFSGTSMAAPHVAGAWAILRSRAADASVTEILDAFTSTGVPVFDPGNGRTYRRINVAGAVQFLVPPCTYAVSPLSFAFDRNGGAGTIDVITQPGCAWQASSGWALVHMPVTQGTGSASLTFTVSANPFDQESTGVIDVAGFRVTLSIAGAIASMNRDAFADLIWQHTDGRLATWFLRGRDVLGTSPLSVDRVDPSWRVAGSGDIDGNGSTDLVWQRSDGSLWTWLMRGTVVHRTLPLSIDRVGDTAWQIVGVADLDGDGYADLVWQHPSGHLAAWFMQGTRVLRTTMLSIDRVMDTRWQVASAGDLSGDGKADLVWQHVPTGQLAVWYMNGATVTATLGLGTVSDPAWRIRGVGDTDDDGFADLLWQHETGGGVAVWLMRGTVAVRQIILSISRVDPEWHMRGPG
jgi:subtilisin